MDELSSILRERKEMFVYAISVILAVGLLFYSYSTHQKKQSLERKADRVVTLIENLQTLKQGIQREGASWQPTESPLAYLENLAPKNKLAGLSPTGDGGEGRELYQLRLEALSLSRCLKLLRTLDQDQKVITTQFKLQRVYDDEPTFDLTITVMTRG